MSPQSLVNAWASALASPETSDPLGQPAEVELISIEIAAGHLSTLHAAAMKEGLTPAQLAGRWVDNWLKGIAATERRRTLRKLGF
jgi:hypothetical protein